MQNIFLSIGSNLGNKVKALRSSITLVGEQMGKVLQISAVYETEPWGVKDQDNFYNIVVNIESHLSANELLTKIHWIEKELGRERFEKWGPRRIDIDILYMDQLIFNADSLTIPHGQLYNRNFVLVPLVEIAPEFVDPVTKTTSSYLLNKCPDNGKITRKEQLDNLNL